MSDTYFSFPDTRIEKEIHNFSELLCEPKFFERLTCLLQDRYHKPSQFDAEILKHLAQMPRWLALLVALPYPQYQFSSLLEQWLLADQKYRLVLGHRLEQTCTSPSTFSFPTMNNRLFALLDFLRQRLLSIPHRKRLYFDQKGAGDNYQSCCDYVDQLFDCYSRLVVIRLDFSYDQAFVSSVTFEQAQAHLKQLFNNTRHNKLFNGLEGYIAKIEYGLDKQIHIHSLLFFNGHKRQGSSDVDSAEDIGEYWKNTVTKGTGYYWNCNDKKRCYRYVGIGLIDARDIEKRNNLLIAVQYLCKKDTQVIKPRHQPRAKTLFRGDLRNHNPKLGRPRLSLTVKV